MGLAEAPKWRGWPPSPRSTISGSSNLLPYIIRVDPPPSSSDDLLSYYQTFLPKTTADEECRIIHAYDIIFKGFAARLSTEEGEAMEKIPGFISAEVSAFGPSAFGSQFLSTYTLGTRMKMKMTKKKDPLWRPTDIFGESEHYSTKHRYLSIPSVLKTAMEHEIVHCQRVLCPNIDCAQTSFY